MKKRNFVIIILILIAIVIAVIITNILLDTTGSINQGKFRVNDAVIKSTVEVEEIETQNDEEKGLESLSLNLSQKNSLVLLITKDEEIDNIYIDNIEITNPELIGTFNITDTQSIIDVSNINSKEEQVSIYTDESEGQYLVQIDMNNDNFLVNAKIPSGISSVTYDGTMLKTLNIPLSKLKFDIKFDLNIVDKLGKLNICKINLKLPNDELSENGISVTRDSLSNYIFKVKNITGILNQ